MSGRLVLLCAIVALAAGSISIGKHEPKPDKYKNIEGCYIKELDKVIPFGEETPSLSSCMEYRCSSDTIKYVSCGSLQVQSPLVLKEDMTKPYPDCCPQVSMIQH